MRCMQIEINSPARRFDSVYGNIHHRYLYLLSTYSTSSADTLILNQAQPSVGELRYIARLNRGLLPNGDPESYTDLGSETVEGSDVVGPIRLPEEFRFNT